MPLTPPPNLYNGVFQLAYVTTDLDQAIATYREQYEVASFVKTGRPPARCGGPDRARAAGPTRSDRGTAPTCRSGTASPC
jgi:hypothetical protein